MSQVSFAVKDYRIIKHAKIDPLGITLIWGRNGSGKSTLCKALVTLLSNQHSEDNFRHGQSAYAVAAKVGDNRLVYTRNGETASVKFNEEAARQKLGRAPMSQIEPRFPLKRYDYEDSSFFPNFVFQGKLPVFDDISVYSLFSSMFSNIARISERVTAGRADCLAVAKKKGTSLSNSEMLKRKVVDSSKAVDGLKERYPNLSEDYASLRSLAARKQVIDDFYREYAGLSELCEDSGKMRLADLYDDAAPLFPALLLAQKIQRVMERLEVSNKSLTEVGDELASFPDIFSRVEVPQLVQGVARLRQAEGNLELGRKHLGSIPEVSVSLVECFCRLGRLEGELDKVRGLLAGVPDVSVLLVESCIRIGTAERELAILSLDLGEVSEACAVIEVRLREFPCDRLADGLCPYAYKLQEVLK